ncbi:MAG: hypothetical protein RMM28_11410 [Thermoleophilia bacterium]|nr:hypothetical protein [Thermoleophilia bacterium]
MAVSAAKELSQRQVDRHPPWWTEADAAELDLLTWVLVDAYFEHRPRCSICASGEHPCPHVQRAIREVVEWIELRELASRARWLRLERERLEIRRERLLVQRA